MFLNIEGSEEHDLKRSERRLANTDPGIEVIFCASLVPFEVQLSQQKQTRE